LNFEILMINNICICWGRGTKIKKVYDEHSQSIIAYIMYQENKQVIWKDNKSAKKNIKDI